MTLWPQQKLSENINFKVHVLVPVLSSSVMSDSLRVYGL